MANENLASKLRSAFPGQGCLTLFALPFAGVGIFLAFQLGSALWSFAAVQHWQQVPARILSVDMQTHHGSKSDTYETTARYQYTFAGHTYIGSKVGLQNGGDNVGDWQNRAYYELLPYRNSTFLFRAYVDPADPSQAVLFKDFRWGLAGLKAVGALLFGGVGFGLIFAGIIGNKRLRRKAELKARYPKEPWRQREDWAAGQVRSAARPTMILSMVFAGFWNLISLPLTFMIPGEVMDKGNRLALVALVFPAVGIGLLVWAVRSIIRVRKFGSPILELATLPGTVGGRLAGTLHIGRPLRPEQGFEFTLDGINRRTTGSGKNRSTQERILCQETRTVPLEQIGQDAAGATVPVSFVIPADAPPTDDADSDNRILWRLSVTAALPGVDYGTSFEVPVFRSAAGVHEPDPLLEQPPPTAPAAQDYELLNRAGLRVRRDADALVITLAAARNLKAALGLTAFLAIWSGFTALFRTLDAPVFFVAVFGLFNLLILAATVDLWCGATRMEVRYGELRRRGGLFAWGRERTWRAGDIVRFEIARGMQANRKLFYRLKLVPRQGRARTIASRLESRAQAEALAGGIEAVLRTGRPIAPLQE